MVNLKKKSFGYFPLKTETDNSQANIINNKPR